ncbi:hypothetical protein EW026_g5186 [Hermanssonia centrifuga]|uniref:FAD-binding FR-type domain-containing protein n=1 Tax=Hermanssonia centrifuga TaxID=98765 RepID=A0A4S4KFT7_9APHY|nr:hypothetical protein EW026_g5186 [Hermanssonia centrifuga]
MLQGWHRGVRSVHKRLGFEGPMASAYTWIQGEMSEEHRTFNTTRIPFVPVTTLDTLGRPWSSILAGPSGEPGFISSPSWDRLDMDVRVWNGDPFKDNVRTSHGKKMLLAGIGIDLSSRQRNKFAGYVSELHQAGDIYTFKVIVNQAIGNCPKYINVRELDPNPSTNPAVLYEKTQISPDERLPDELIAFIHAADTAFMGSSYQALGEDEKQFPSHVGHNTRGGRRGFMRVMPSDGKTIILPDYSGDRLMTSLGNIQATPLASLSIVNFVTGDILYLTGNAYTLLGAEAQAIMPRQSVITRITVTGYVYVRDALPIRQRPGTGVQCSPYSPPIKLLAEETAASSYSRYDDQVTATLASIAFHSQDLATFTWNTSRNIHIIPGQSVILDMTDLVGAPQWAHLAPFQPTSLNDDRIRTWTVSRAHLDQDGTNTFSVTLREKKGGVVTGALFSIARKLAELRPEMMKDSKPLNLQVKMVGISGDFTLPLSPSSKETRSFMLWLAGGIGVTPFLSMLAAITGSPSVDLQWNIVFAISTREPEVLIPLVRDALGGGETSKLHLVVDIFSNNSMSSSLDWVPTGGTDVSLTAYQGRISDTYIGRFHDLKSKTYKADIPNQLFESHLNIE